MTRNQLVSLAGLGSAALLAGAFAFEYLGDMAPCVLCIWQRWPHAVAVVIMIAALALRRGRFLPLLGMTAALTTAAIGGFHLGVEQGWWEGLASCTASSLTGVNMADLLNPDVVVAAPIRCDAIAWALFGISMAGWNMIASLGLAGIWGLAATRQA